MIKYSILITLLSMRSKNRMRTPSMNTFLLCDKKDTSKDIHLLYKLNQLLVERNLLEPYNKILIAVSGGQDSIALLYLLYNLRLQWNWKLSIVHSNHQWHTNSLLQAKQIYRLAHNMNIKNYQSVALKNVQTEQTARNWRYALFQSIAIYHKYDSIVTGHTASDRVETLLHNLLRGTGFKGLQSLNWKRILDKTIKINITNNISLSTKDYKNLQFRWYHNYIYNENRNIKLQLIRPLLYFTRTELKNFVNQFNLSVCSDPTNKILLIRRNRIRYQLLPYLRKYFNPKIDFILNSLAELAQAEYAYLNNITKYFYNKSIIVNHNKFILKSQTSINIEFIHTLPLIFQRRILKEFLNISTRTSVNFDTVERVRLLTLVPINYKKKNTILIKKGRYIALSDKITICILHNILIVEQDVNNI